MGAMPALTWTVALLVMFLSLARGRSDALRAESSSIPILLDASKRLLDREVDRLIANLFPDLIQKQEGSEADVDSGSRRLQVTKVPYNASEPVTCGKCQALQYCPALNDFSVQETYYPSNKDSLETCKVIDAFGARISKLVFGTGKTFRDTPQCRDIVMQYLCLHYGSDNEMYTNYCVYQEVTDPVNDKSMLAARAPCHSFCVQVAMICANEPDYFIQTCERIPCPYPKDKTCTADPKLKKQPLESNLGCSVPYYSSPYFRAAAAPRLPTGATAVAVAVAVVLCSLWMAAIA